MNKIEIMEMFKGVGAIITDSHVVYASGRHGSAYINKDAVYPYTDVISGLCREMAGRFMNQKIDVVAGPTVGGVILSQWVAHYLSQHYKRAVLAVFAEKDEDGNRFFKRGYDKLIAGRDVLVVEDILTTGGSVKKVVDAVRKSGGRVAGCVALCNRGGVNAEDVGGVPRFEALIEVNMDSWEEAACPLCMEGRPINTDVGKGREYLARKRGSHQITPT